MSEVEWAGSVETSNTRRPARLAASAAAAAHVVLPTPPLPPKKRIWRRSRSCTSAAGERPQGRAINPQAAVPQMELLEQERVEVEQIKRRRVPHAHQLEIAEEHEQVVERQRLLAQFVLIAAVGGAPEDVPQRTVHISPGHPSQLTADEAAPSSRADWKAFGPASVTSSGLTGCVQLSESPIDK